MHPAVHHEHGLFFYFFYFYSPQLMLTPGTLTTVDILSLLAPV